MFLFLSLCFINLLLRSLILFIASEERGRLLIPRIILVPASWLTTICTVWSRVRVSFYRNSCFWTDLDDRPTTNWSFKDIFRFSNLQITANLLIINFNRKTMTDSSDCWYRLKNLNLSEICFGCRFSDSSKLLRTGQMCVSLAFLVILIVSP